jgi:hypothetical protein
VITNTQELRRASPEQRKELVRAAVDSASTNQERKDVLQIVVRAAEDPKDVVEACVQGASPQERHDMLRSVVNAAGIPKDLIKTALESATTEDRKDVVKTALEAASTTPAERKDVVKTAVEAASSADEQRDVAVAALDSLSQEQQQEVIESRWPPGSRDRRWVYVTGFVVAGVVAVGLAAIAWGAQSGDNSIAASLVVLATGFASAMLGGLLGAYIQK